MGYAEAESEGLLHKVPAGEHTDRTQDRKFNTILFVLTIFNVLLFGVSTTLLGIWQHRLSHFPRNPELKQSITYSPVYDLIDLGLRSVQINGTLYPPIQPSIARQLPNPLADSIWEDFEKVRPLRLTRSEITRMGKDPANVAQYKDADWGFGDDAYVGDLDVFHQLHCLNTLRKYAYASYYNMSALDASEVSLANLHVNHCVDILFQEVQCSGNAGYITSGWVENMQYPQPDMSINRKCIVFDRIVEWRNSQAVDSGMYEKSMVNP